MEYQEQKSGPDLDEINLLQYFQVIWRKKFLIIAICLIAVIAAAIISYIMPPVYRVTASVILGWLSMTSDGKGMYVDSVENVKALIEDGVFEYKNRRISEIKPYVLFWNRIQNQTGKKL
jgi:LPS O-antigen subunit length determinant protein (WzzB/FepE family)